jgi:DNA-binding transcriptional ArsR family regulator
LRRLSIVFADPLRLKIVTELYMRPMSATEFFRAFGGGSVQRVDRHFKKLAEHGWLQLQGTKRGGRRRGATERFYRATELAIFDLATWSELPYSIRVDFSHRIFEQFAERVRQAIEARTFDARPERHFSWTPIVLDQLGWERVVAATDALFEFVFGEQKKAGIRITKSGEAPMLATVAFATFESPGHEEEEGRLDQPEAESFSPGSGDNQEPPVPYTLRLAKVFADPLNLKIVAELNLRQMSPTQFWHEFGGSSKQDLDRRFKKLTEFGWLFKAGEKSGGRRRGATEHFYRAASPVVFDNQSWSEVPDSIRTDFSWRIFEQLAEQVTNAMSAGTFDARPERHLTWSLLSLDEPGWQRVVAAVDGLFRSLFEEERHAKARISESGEPTLRATVALAAFESPPHTGPKAH